jgi:hypothetical protein
MRLVAFFTCILVVQRYSNYFKHVKLFSRCVDAHIHKLYPSQTSTHFIPDQSRQTCMCCDVKANHLEFERQCQTLNEGICELLDDLNARSVIRRAAMTRERLNKLKKSISARWLALELLIQIIIV